MIRLIFSMIFLLLPSTGSAQEPIKHACHTNVQGMQVRIVGQRGDLIELHDTINRRHYRAYAESREDMDGARGVLNCGAVFSGEDVIVIRTGRKADYVQIYGVSRSASGIDHLFQYRWNPLDSRIEVSVSRTGEVRLRNGRRSDRYYTVCWDGISRSFRHSVAASQFTRGHLPCNEPLPSTQVHRLEIKHVSRDLPPPPPPTRERPPPQITGYRLFCQSSGGGSGNIEFWGGGSNCEAALSDARSKIARLGGCLQIGSNYTEVRREMLRTTVCR